MDIDGLLSDTHFIIYSSSPDTHFLASLNRGLWRGCTLTNDAVAGLSRTIGWRLQVRVSMMAGADSSRFPPAVFELSWRPDSLSAGWVTDAGRRYICFVWRRCILRGVWRHLWHGMGQRPGRVDDDAGKSKGVMRVYGVSAVSQCNSARLSVDMR